MAEKLLSGFFLIGTVGLILTHSQEFSTLVRGIGSNYAATVRGFQGR